MHAHEQTMTVAELPMRVVELQGGFGLDHVAFGQRPAPRPGPGQVLLRMRAASINYRDLLMIEGQYNPRQPLPLIPLSDGVGEVIEMGADVSRIAIGDRVAPIFAQQWLAGAPTKERLRATLGGPLPGVLQEMAVFPAESVVRVPEHLSDVEAATLPCAGLTAWTALVEQGGVQPGDTVLVQGTGGVSLFALQFALIAGARVIITSSSEAKLARARDLGAWQGIHYPSTPDWGRRVLELTEGRGVDHVIEVGGAGTLGESLKAVRPGGHIAIIGMLAGSMLKTSLLPVLMRNLRLHGVLVGHRDGFEAMNRAVERHGLHPVVDRVYGWNELQAAFEYLRSGQHFGKVCLTLT
jgi:NADPH:quinone reductase-like Zn-dependent oxidoreductase